MSVGADGTGGGLGVELVRVVEDGRLGRAGGRAVVVTRDRVQELCEDGRVEMKQVEYDPEPVVAQVQADPLLPGPARRILSDVYRLGRYVHPPELPTIHRNGSNGHAHSSSSLVAHAVSA